MTSGTPSWGSPGPGDLVLRRGKIHVWCACLDIEQCQVRGLELSLAPYEQRRANLFPREIERRRFVAARGLLRVILGRYLDTAPSSLRFDRNTYGKPFLVGHSEVDGLRFNLSHAGAMCLYAVSRGREVGIDIERIRSDWALGQIAQRLFAPREVAKLRALGEDVLQDAFFKCWTRKEAYLKARGDGLSRDLSQFEVTLAPGEPARLLASVEGSLESSRWRFEDLNVGPGYVAVLAAEGHDWELLHWRLSGERALSTSALNRCR